MSLRALLIDNYDSFTFNLSRYFRELFVEVDVVKNDIPCPDKIALSLYDFIVISPGPGNPMQSGISLPIIKSCLFYKPLLGICLGHQCLAHCLGTHITRAKKIIHGKVSRIRHNHDPIFNKIPQQFNVTRYHSLAVEINTLHPDLAVCAWHENEIMAIKHLHSLAYGVQFHPEAFLTEYGHQLLSNFLTLVRQNQHERNITNLNRQKTFA